MKKDVALILVVMLVVFSTCACSVPAKGTAEEKLDVQERPEGNYIKTAKNLQKDLGCQALILVRKALGVRVSQSDNAVENDESYLADLADSISDKGRAFACDTGLLSLYRSFCLYSPFSLLL